MAFGSEILVKRNAGVFAWTSLVAGLGLLCIAGFFLTPAWRAPAGAIFFGAFGLFRSDEIRYSELVGFTFIEEFRFTKFIIRQGERW